MSNLLGNAPLEKAMQANLQHLGPPPFDDKDRAFAKKMQATFQPEDIATSCKRFGVAPRRCGAGRTGGAGGFAARAAARLDRRR